MKYSFNRERQGVVMAQKYDINASYKHLGAVCDAIRYMRVDRALNLIDSLIAMEQPIPFRTHNKHMGARHELGGRKGAYPVRAAKHIRLTLLNAIGNAKNFGLDGNDLYVVHACANKTRIERRYPPKGSITGVHGSYMGATPMRHMDLEYAKIEIGLGQGDEKGLSKNMRYFIKAKERAVKKEKIMAMAKGLVPKQAPDKKPAAKKADAPKQIVAPKPEVKPAAQKPAAQKEEKPAEQVKKA